MSKLIGPTPRLFGSLAQHSSMAQIGHPETFPNREVGDTSPRMDSVERSMEPKPRAHTDVLVACLWRAYLGRAGMVRIKVPDEQVHRSYMRFVQ